MTTITRAIAGLPRVPLAVFLLAALLVVGSRVATLTFGDMPGAGPIAGAATPADAPDPDPDPATAETDPLIPAGATVAADDLERIRANVAFWGDRYQVTPTDFISATRFAGASIDLARATGDLSRYVAAEAAIDGALASVPGHGPARGLRGVVLVALHRFPEARDHALTMLTEGPDDPAALATLGDATLELGDLTAAAGAYEQLRLVADGAPADIRLARLAFIRGRPAEAVDGARTAVASAVDEGAIGGSLAWYHVQLADLLLATGDRPGAEGALADALSADPASHLALALRARLAAADGRLDDAIADLDRAIAVVPLPELLARRADLFDLRAAADDDRRSADDRATVLAIAELAGDAAGVYDRTLSLYLASTGVDPARALTLAEDEIAVRTDVYGYDALGWALLANGRATEADAAMTRALAAGTRDARLLYHAGMAAAAVGDADRARSLLEDALGLDPTFDPVGVARARTTLAELP
jgi:tetratricopeptide (TPR) repeat protein